MLRQPSPWVDAAPRTWMPGGAVDSFADLDHGNRFLRRDALTKKRRSTALGRSRRDGFDKKRPYRKPPCECPRRSPEDGYNRISGRSLRSISRDTQPASRISRFKLAVSIMVFAGFA